jgi:hypothetical protein
LCRLAGQRHLVNEMSLVPDVWSRKVGRRLHQQGEPGEPGKLESQEETCGWH